MKVCGQLCRVEPHVLERCRSGEGGHAQDIPVREADLDRGCSFDDCTPEPIEVTRDPDGSFRLPDSAPADEEWRSTQAAVFSANCKPSEATSRN